MRDEAKDFVLTKELRNLDFDGLGERETLEKVYEYFKKKYSLGSDMRINRENLEACGYNFDHEIDSKILQGIFRTTEELALGVGKNNVTIKTAVNTHSHGIYLLHSVDEIKKVTGLQSQKVKNILRRMFSKGKKTKYKFVALENSDFYAFIINNVKQLKIDFKGCTAQMGGRQMSFVLEPKQAEFSIPEMEIYKYSEVKKRQLIDSYRRKAKEAQEEYVEWYESICNAIADFCESLYKDTDAIISENDDFFSALWDVNQVVCLGLSFGDVDVPYLDRIEYEVRPETKWLVYYHSDEDLKRLKSVFGITGISRKFEVYFRKSDNFWDR